MENKIIKVRGRISKMTAAYIIAAMVLATLFLCVMFYLSLMERIYADSSLYLNELAYNVADAIHSDIVEQLKRADRIRKRIFPQRRQWVLARS